MWGFVLLYVHATCMLEQRDEMCSGEWAKAVRGESQPMNALVLGWAREKMVRKRRGGGETQAGNAVSWLSCDL